MEFILIIILTMSSGEKDPKTIELKIPQKTKEECLQSAKSLNFKLPIPGLAVSMKSRCEPKRDKEEPGVTQVET
jgi:hypothetical protein